MDGSEWEAYTEGKKWRGYGQQIREGIRWFEEQPKEELSLISRDGLRLRGSYLEAENPQA